MRVTVDGIERIVNVALTRTGFATLMIWGVAGAIWWQALA
jgi:hypothetical protein